LSFLNANQNMFLLHHFCLEFHTMFRFYGHICCQQENQLVFILHWEKYEKCQIIQFEQNISNFEENFLNFGDNFNFFQTFFPLCSKSNQLGYGTVRVTLRNIYIFIQ